MGKSLPGDDGDSPVAQELPGIYVQCDKSMERA